MGWLEGDSWKDNFIQEQFFAVTLGNEIVFVLKDL